MTDRTITQQIAEAVRAERERLRAVLPDHRMAATSLQDGAYYGLCGCGWVSRASNTEDDAVARWVDHVFARAIEDDDHG